MTFTSLMLQNRQEYCEKNKYGNDQWDMGQTHENPALFGGSHRRKIISSFNGSQRAATCLKGHFDFLHVFLCNN